MAEARGIADAVHFDGQVSDIDRWYRRLDARSFCHLERRFTSGDYGGDVLRDPDHRSRYCRESRVRYRWRDGIRHSRRQFAGNLPKTGGTRGEIWIYVVRWEPKPAGSRLYRFSLERVTREVSALYQSLLGSREGDGDCAGWNLLMHALLWLPS